MCYSGHSKLLWPGPWKDRRLCGVLRISKEGSVRKAFRRRGFGPRGVWVSRRAGVGFQEVLRSRDYSRGLLLVRRRFLFPRVLELLMARRVAGWGFLFGGCRLGLSGGGGYFLTPIRLASQEPSFRYLKVGSDPVMVRRPNSREPLKRWARGVVRPPAGPGAPRSARRGAEGARSMVRIGSGNGSGSRCLFRPFPRSPARPAPTRVLSSHGVRKGQGWCGQGPLRPSQAAPPWRVPSTPEGFRRLSGSGPRGLYRHG